MDNLTTARLLLRNFQSADAEDLHEMILQYQASGLAVYDHAWPSALAEVRKVTEWFAQGDNFLAVYYQPASKVIGFIAFNRVYEDPPVYNLGYLFNSDFHHQGFALEACTAVLDHAFTDLAAQRVESGTAAMNSASRRLLANLGFQPVREQETSFQCDSKGTPISFTGIVYELPRASWLSRST